MSPIEIIVIIIASLIVIAVFGVRLYKRIKHKDVGCDCCSNCAHCQYHCSRSKK